ncbi:hypothetical protein [Laspinema olomoucense]|uniref:hypothetical protein n=1 Tax=Laspinema olomoucense TaxID=3231600 RepID=UPI0021BBA245|nr:hypothetical protein [Laspinema sp. D3a]MCT7987325.1 hypothetical protein [Laspinema sp. D3a]
MFKPDRLQMLADPIEATIVDLGDDLGDGILQVKWKGSYWNATPFDRTQQNNFRLGDPVLVVATQVTRVFIVARQQ